MNGKKIKKNYQIKFSIISLIVVTSLFCFSRLHAQDFTKSTLLRMAMNVNVENIIIQSDSLIDGLSPNFPYPILAAISIIDNQGNFVTGLADTSRWLGPDDLAQIGLPIAEIWNPVVEYHKANPNIPKNSDVYDQAQAPQFKEIRKDIHIPTSTMLVMDVSTSMTYKLDSAKHAALLYIDLLRPVDRAGIVLFNHEVVKIQKFTNNKDKLIQTINNAQTDFGTAIYDALMAAIEETKAEKSRPRIIVYTDGRDNNSNHTPGDVIEIAQKYDIPIYTISLKGGYVIEDTLKLIAAKTGGLFFRADSADQMGDIYEKLFDLVQHFYVMAHFSPDPIRNDTWRTVDITVNAPDSNGDFNTSRGTGNYFIKGSPPELASDIAVDLVSNTDSTVVESGDTLSAVFPGDQYSYVIKLRNIGQSRANYIKLSYQLPDSTQMIDTPIQPDEQKNGRYVWHLYGCDKDEEIDIEINVQFASRVPKHISELTSSAELIADNDYNPDNNADQEIVRVLFPLPIVDYDLALSQTVTTDTTVIIDNRSIQVVYAGETLSYTLSVENFGPATAFDFVIKDAIPESIDIVQFEIEPFLQTRDTLFWRFDSLPAGEKMTLSFQAVAREPLTYFPYPLPNESWVSGENDILDQNNYAATTAYVISVLNKQPLVAVDIAIAQSAKTDSFSVVENDTLWFARPGETYRYHLTAINFGFEDAHAVRIVNYFPDSVTAQNFEPAPAVVTDDSVTWYFENFASFSLQKLQFDVTVSPNMPIGNNLLINEVNVMADNEDSASLANNTAIDTVFNTVTTPVNLLPSITATPPHVDVGEPVSVAVQVPYPIQSWDVWVYLADGTIDKSYADSYIENTHLEMNRWYNIDETFTNTRLFTSAGQEQILFELRTEDIFGEIRTVRTSVTVTSSNNFYLDRNIFEVQQPEPLTVNFKLSTNRIARLELYDVTGKKLTNLVEAPFQAGWNKFQWNGILENGQRIGSGLYLIALKSENYNVLKKVMIVQ